jgi:hypothetical protein
MNPCVHPKPILAGHFNDSKIDNLWCAECGALRVNGVWQEPYRSSSSLQALAIAPVPLILTCPCCGHRHIDEGEFAEKVHHTHACQFCGMCWRPSIIPTVGVRFLPGFKNGVK